MVALIRILALMEKDFRMIYRNKVVLVMLVLYPQFYFFVTPYLVNFNLCEFRVALVDNDHSEFSSRIASDISHSSQLSLEKSCATFVDAKAALDKGDVHCILEIPSGCERWMMTNVQDQSYNIQGRKISVTTNAVSISSAILGTQHLLGIINGTLRECAASKGMAYDLQAGFSISALYNPSLDFLLFILSVLLIPLAMMICNNTTMSVITDDFESGACDMLNISPASSNQIVLSRVLTCYCIGIVEMLYMQLSLRVAYGLTLLGSSFATLLMFLLFLLWTVSLVQLVGNFFDSALSIAILYSILTVLGQMASGYETPIESMREWVQDLTYISPTRYIVEGLRGTFLRGADFADLMWQIMPLAGLSLLTYTLAVVTYNRRKR